MTMKKPKHVNGFGIHLMRETIFKLWLHVVIEIETPPHLSTTFRIRISNFSKEKK